MTTTTNEPTTAGTTTETVSLFCEVVDGPTWPIWLRIFPSTPNLGPDGEEIPEKDVELSREFTLEDALEAEGLWMGHHSWTPTKRGHCFWVTREVTK
jgi:hypothetical protein